MEQFLEYLNSTVEIRGGMVGINEHFVDINRRGVPARLVLRGSEVAFLTAHPEGGWERKFWSLGFAQSKRTLDYFMVCAD